MRTTFKELPKETYRSHRENVITPLDELQLLHGTDDSDGENFPKCATEKNIFFLGKVEFSEPWVSNCSTHKMFFYQTNTDKLNNSWPSPKM